MKKNGEYIGVDEKYIPEEEKYVENSNKKGKKLLLGLGIGHLILMAIILIVVIVFMIFIFNFFSKTFNTANDIIDTAGDVIDSTSDSIDNTEVNIFNSIFSMMEGSCSGLMVRSMLDQVIISNNNYSNHTISVSYNGSIVSTDDEITSLKESIDNSLNYEVSLSYDAEGYINLINID